MNDEVVRRKPGRPRRVPFQSILSPDVIANIKGITPEEEQAAKEKREAERQRGIKRRAAARAEKQVESVETKEQLWQLNRATLPEAELNALLERQEVVSDLTFAMRKCVNGIYEATTDEEDRVPLEAITGEVEEEVATHGMVTMELALLGQYWKQPIYQERFQGSDPDSVFARLGVVISLPSHSVHRFQQFIATHKATQSVASTAASAPSNGYVKMKCTCDALAGELTVPIELAEAYARLGKKFQCAKCRAIEAQSRQQSTLHKRGVIGGPDTIYGPGSSK